MLFPKVLRPSQLELWEEAETVWRKDMRGRGGGERRKQPSVKKISPQFKVSFGQTGLRQSKEERPQGRTGSSTSRSGPAESGPTSFVYRGAPLWCTSAYLMGIKKNYRK